MANNNLLLELSKLFARYAENIPCKVDKLCMSGDSDIYLFIFAASNLKHLKL